MSCLVVAAHPDDEALGAGGTIARYVQFGEQVHIVFVADGETSRPGHAGGSIEHRFAAAREAASVLGAEPPTFLGFPDQRLDTIAFLDIVQSIEAAMREVEPAIVYTHNPTDLNSDHRIVCKAAMTACRPVPGTPVKAIYGFEVASSTEWSVLGAGVPFAPQRFVDIETTLETKLKALRAYDKEMRPMPHPRSYEGITALATWRGVSVGLNAAEAFVVLRDIDSG